MAAEVGRASLDRPSTPKTSAVNTTTPSKTMSTLPPSQDAEMRGRLDKVLHSDIGVNTLLTRLKQSISSAREFSGFLKKRATLEEEHATGINRLTRSTHDVLGKPENRQGSFAFNYREIGSIHERMAKNSEDFAHTLLVMSDELQELALHCEKGRKQWKHTGLEAEQRAQEAENALEKAKSRYFSVADQYDRLRTGERQGGKFGLKGPKSAQQQEESLLSKAETADQDYRGRVEAAQSQRNELLSQSRPRAVKELENYIMECDAGVSMQLQKFAMLTEKLLLSNGLCISPLKGQENGSSPASRSLREVAQAISNQKDFEDFVLGHSSKVGPTPAEIRYEKHPALTPSQSQPVQPSTSNNFSTPPARTDTGFGSMTGAARPGGPPPAQSFGAPPALSDQYPGNQASTISSAPQLPQIGTLSSANKTSLEDDHLGSPHAPGTYYSGPTHQHPSHSYSQSYSQPTSQPYSPPYSLPDGPTTGNPSKQASIANQGPMGAGIGRGHSPMASGHHYGTSGASEYSHNNRGPSLGQPTDFRSQGRGQLPSLTHQSHPSDPRGLPRQSDSYNIPEHNNGGSNISSQSGPMNMPKGPQGRPNLPPLKPVFGVPLDELFRRDGAAVPAIVYQCIQAVDLFGLTTEGIYRVPGNASHIAELHAQFDNDSSQVDFRTPARFYNDISSVTTLLKQFLRDLPDPLLTSAQYSSFIQAAKIDEDIVRRDSLHAIINSLPDPNYATLRTLVLHLYRIAQNSEQNRMTASNLAIVFGPTLMGGQGAIPATEIQDAGWQARVIETILANTLEIFDDDE